MFTAFLSAIVSIPSWFRTRASLQVEILALRHQVAVLKRSQRGRVRLNSVDRLLWVWLSRIWSQWRLALIIVKPETVIAWHRKGFRLYWTWKTGRGTPGRPEVCQEIRELIRKMGMANPFWGHLGSVVSFSKSASRCPKQLWPSTWFASLNRPLRDGAPFSTIM